LDAVIVVIFTIVFMLSDTVFVIDLLDRQDVRLCNTSAL
jgi:hypothetical protein